MRLPSGVIPFQTQSDTGLNTQKVRRGHPCAMSAKFFDYQAPLSLLGLTSYFISSAFGAPHLLPRFADIIYEWSPNCRQLPHSYLQLVMFREAGILCQKQSSGEKVIYSVKDLHSEAASAEGCVII